VRAAQIDLAGMFTDYLQGKRSLAELLLYKEDKPSRVRVVFSSGAVAEGAAASMPCVCMPRLADPADAPPWEKVP
jgi:hypothetical protein